MMKYSIVNLSIIMLIVSICVSCGNNEKTKQEFDYHIGAIDSLSLELYKVLDSTIIPGFAVSVIQNDTVILNKGFGYSDMNSKTPFSENTPHTIASISKTFIALAIMKLVEEGKLTLDQKVNDILPFEIHNPHYPNTPIRVKHLVTHTSSINDDFNDGDKRASWLVEPLPADYDDLHQDIKDDIFYYDGSKTSLSEYLISFCSTGGKWYDKNNFSKFKPGTKYEYSNAGATVAALIVEIISEMSYAAYTSKNIFQPLGMQNTSWYYDTLDSTYSKLYVEKNGNISEFPRYHEASYPDGQLKTTSNDLSKYLLEIIKGYKGKGLLLTSESYSYMLSHQLERSAFDDPDAYRLNDEYGVGVFWGISEPGYILHKGGMIGVYSILYYNPKSDVGVIAFCNMAHPDFGKVLNVLDQYETSTVKTEGSL